MGCTALSEGISAGIMLLFYRREVRRYFKGAACRAPRQPGRRIWESLVAGRGRKVPCQRLAYSGKYAGACLFGRISGGGRWAQCSGGAVRQLERHGAAAADLSLWAAGQFVGAADAKMTQAQLRGEQDRLAALLDRMLRLTGYFSALAAALFWVWGVPLAQGLYGSGEAGFYLRVLAPAMPLMYLESMVDGAMKGLGEQKAVFRYSVWDSILRIAGVVFLLPRFGMKGFLFVVADLPVFIPAQPIPDGCSRCVVCRCNGCAGWGRLHCRGWRRRLRGCGCAAAWDLCWRRAGLSSWRHWLWVLLAQRWQGRQQHGPWVWGRRCVRRWGAKAPPETEKPLGWAAGTGCFLKKPLQRRRLKSKRLDMRRQI